MTKTPAPTPTTGPQRSQPGGGLSRGLLLLMATATGLSVAGNYFAQPLLDVMGRDLDLSTTLAGLIVTAAQLGYALGLMLLIPLGDMLDRRRLAVGLFAATAVFLVVTATATNGPVLLIGTVLAALTSVGAQVIVPFAVTLADPADRGRVVGVVMAGILFGGLLARTVAGGLSELGGWRTVYWVNAVLMVAMALLLRARLPRLPRATGENGPVLRYPALLRSTLALLRTEPVLRRRAALGALAQASYSVQLTVLTFLLVGRDYGWTEAAIGLFGLVGGVGLLIMPMVGRLTDRGHVQKVSGVGTVLLAVSWLVLLGATSSLLWLAIGIVTLNLAIQAVLISSQSVVYALRPEARNRINSAFMTSYFLGGAGGAAVASATWAYGGWTTACLVGAVLATGSVLLWLAEYREHRTAARTARTAAPHPGADAPAAGAAAAPAAHAPAPAGGRAAGTPAAAPATHAPAAEPVA